MVLLLSATVCVLVAWTAVALGVGVVLGRICRFRDQQVALRDSREPADDGLSPAVSEGTGAARSSADAVERWGS